MTKSEVKFFYIRAARGKLPIKIYLQDVFNAWGAILIEQDDTVKRYMDNIKNLLGYCV